jgi:O-antigen/teichoic acid export membrane protein
MSDSEVRDKISALSLRRNLSWTFAGNVVYVCCQWGMLVVLAKLGNPEMVGRFALGLAVTAPIILLANLALRQVQATDARGRYAFSDYFALRLATTALAFLVIIGVSLAAGYRWDTVLVIIVVGLAKSFEALSDIIFGLLQQRERMDRISKSMMIKGPLSLATLGLGVYLFGNLFWGVVGLAIAWAVVLVFYDLRSISSVGESLPRQRKALKKAQCGIEELAKLAWTALPLGVVAALVSLNTNIPRYMIEHYLGEREVGLFSAMVYMMVAGSVVVGALGQSSAARLASHYADQNYRAFHSMLLTLVGLGGLLGVAGVLLALIAGRWILTFLYTPEYAEYAHTFVFVMIAAGITFVASPLAYGMIAARHFRAQVPLFIGVAGATAVGCIIFVPAAGILGAAVAVVIGTVFQLVGSVLILLRATRIQQEKVGVH